MVPKVLALAICIPLLEASASEAAIFEYSYTFSNMTVVSGSIDGELQADSNSILVDEFGDVFVDGQFFFGDPVDKTDFFLDLPFRFTIDGLDLNFSIDDNFSAENFEFNRFFQRSATTDEVFFGPDGLFETFDATRWRVAEVPLPAAGLLLLSGVGGIAALFRRKRRAI